MASRHTAHYGLHLWEPEDSFSREEFNENSQKTDDAIQAAAAKGAQTSSALETVNYNVYQLLLQNYYDGKHTGYKKAMVFDGFRDAAQVESTTAALGVNTAEKTLFLTVGGATSLSTNFGCSNATNVLTNKTASASFTATESTTITAVRLYMSGSGRLTLQESSGTNVFIKEISASGWKQVTSFPVSATLRAGVSYQLAFTGSSDSYLGYQDKSTTFGYYLDLAPNTASTGTMVSRAYGLTGGVSRAVGWVRYSSGAVDLALAGSNGVFYPTTAKGTRSTTAMDGRSCQEATFALERGMAGPIKVKLTLRAGGQNMSVYDYGVVLT